MLIGVGLGKNSPDHGLEPHKVRAEEERVWSSLCFSTPPQASWNKVLVVMALRHCGRHYCYLLCYYCYSIVLLLNGCEMVDIGWLTPE